MKATNMKTDPDLLTVLRQIAAAANSIANDLSEFRSALPYFIRSASNDLTAHRRFECRIEWLPISEALARAGISRRQLQRYDSKLDLNISDGMISRRSFLELVEAIRKANHDRAVAGYKKAGSKLKPKKNLKKNR